MDQNSSALLRLHLEELILFDKELQKDYNDASQIEVINSYAYIFGRD